MPDNYEVGGTYEAEDGKRYTLTENGWQAAPIPGKFFDAASSLPTGILKGASEAISSSGQAAQAEMGQEPNVPGAAETKGLLEKNVTGPMYKPQTWAGKLGERAGEFLGNPATYLGPATLPMKIGTAIGAGIGSSGAEQLAQGAGFDKAAPYASMVGALLGGSAVPKGTQLARQPIIAKPEVAGPARVLEAHDIPVTAGRATGNKFLTQKEGNFATAATAPDWVKNLPEVQGKATNKAMMGKMGSDSELLTRDAVDAGLTKVGKDFDDTARRNTVNFDQQMFDGIDDTVKNYAQAIGKPVDQVPKLSPWVDKVLLGKSGKPMPNAQVMNMDGDRYLNIRSNLSKRAQTISEKDPDLATAYRQMRDHLDDAMERSIAVNNPTDSGTFKQLRNQYQAGLALKDASGKAGQQAAQGFPGPGAVFQAAKNDKGSELAPLARAAEALNGPLPPYKPGSGIIPGGLVGPLTTALASRYGAAEPATTGILAGMSAPYLTRALGGLGRHIGAPILFSKPVQSWLKRQAAPTPGDPSTMARILLASPPTAQGGSQ